MLQAKARWRIGRPDEEQAARLAEALSIPPLLARLLIVRGITDIDQAASFLYGGEDQRHDPFLLDGMNTAVERIRSALERKERIRVYGDYDADGVSSTSLMVHLLRELDASFDTYIPHRVQEGYGLNVAALDAAKASGVSLLITVDTGVSAVAEIEHARQLGIDVIVTDHHEPPELLPQPLALINPKKPGCPYPYKHLAGVGVALKLAEALLGRWPVQLLELAAIGTVADLMPLTDENRLIVKEGLGQMRVTGNAGIRALLSVAGVDAKEVNATHIGFALAPRINASGRLVSADAAVRLLTTADEREAERLASELDELNKERQRLVDDMTKQAVAMVEADKTKRGSLPQAIVLAQEEWNVGVIGIVASKLVDRYYRPTVVLGIDPATGLAKGSARSIAGFDMHKALTHCRDVLDHYGGHQMAAGMTLARGQLPELSRRLSRLAEEWLTPEDWIPVVQADLRCGFDEVKQETIHKLEMLGPFGTGNPAPKFMFCGLRLKDLRTMGKEQQHLKLSLKGLDEAAAAVDAVGFNKGELAEWIAPSASIDVLGELALNEWNGVRRPQILLKDLRIEEIQLFDWRGAPRPERRLAELIKRLADGPQPPGVPVAALTFSVFAPVALEGLRSPYTLWRAELDGTVSPLNEAARQSDWSEAKDIMLYDMPESLEQLQEATRQASAAERYYAAFGGTEEDKLSATLPDRDQFKRVFAQIASLQQGQMPFDREDGFRAWLVRQSGVKPALCAFIVAVFEELGFIRRAGAGYVRVPDAPKRDLTSSRRYQCREKRPRVEQELLYSTARELARLLHPQAVAHNSFLEESV